MVTMVICYAVVTMLNFTWNSLKISILCQRADEQLNHPLIINLFFFHHNGANIFHVVEITPWQKCWVYWPLALMTVSLFLQFENLEVLYKDGRSWEPRNYSSIRPSPRREIWRWRVWGRDRTLHGLYNVNSWNPEDRWVRKFLLPSK